MNTTIKFSINLYIATTTHYYYYYYYYYCCYYYDYYSNLQKLYTVVSIFVLCVLLLSYCLLLSIQSSHCLCILSYLQISCCFTKRCIVLSNIRQRKKSNPLFHYMYIYTIICSFSTLIRQCSLTHSLPPSLTHSHVFPVSIIFNTVSISINSKETKVLSTLYILYIAISI